MSVRGGIAKRLEGVYCSNMLNANVFCFCMTTTVCMMWISSAAHAHHQQFKGEDLMHIQMLKYSFSFVLICSLYRWNGRVSYKLPSTICSEWQLYLNTPESDNVFLRYGGLDTKNSSCVMTSRQVLHTVCEDTQKPLRMQKDPISQASVRQRNSSPKWSLWHLIHTKNNLTMFKCPQWGSKHSSLAVRLKANVCFFTVH